MKSEQTRGIVLSRTDFGEADRIVTMLTPDHGKLRLMVRGARRLKSKMAGGIELFSISDISFIKGRGEILTLVSTRLRQHFGAIVSDVDRVQLGYKILKDINRHTEDQADQTYFDLLQNVLVALDDVAVPLELIQTWFEAQMIRLSGHQPNLQTDAAGAKLDPTKNYLFDLENMCLSQSDRGDLAQDQIKLLRLLFDNYSPRQLAAIESASTKIGTFKMYVNRAYKVYLT